MVFNFARIFIREALISRKSREILKRKFPSVDKPLKKGFEKYKLRG